MHLNCIQLTLSMIDDTFKPNFKQTQTTEQYSNLHNSALNKEDKSKVISQWIIQNHVEYEYSCDR